MKRILLIAVVFALFTTAASAQRGQDRIEGSRIQRGFETGQLTRGEKTRLRENQVRYHHARRRSHRDGKVNNYERRRLHHMKHHNSRRIYAMKHNSRRRLL